MRLALLWVSILVVVAGCGVEGTLTRWSDGLVGSVKTNADTIGAKLGGGLIHGVRDSLTSAESSARLAALIDSLIGAAVQSARRNSPGLVDSVLGPAMQRRVESLAGVLRLQTGSLRDDLLGARTRGYLEALRDTLLGVGTRERVAFLRDELLGASTRSAVMSLVDSVLQGPVRKYQAGLQEAIHTEAGFFQRNAVTILILIAVLAAGVIAFVWWQRGRYRQTVQLLTHQIQDIGDERAYAELTDRIRRSAQHSGLDKVLRKEMGSEGILETAVQRRRAASLP